ncbi:major facilitator superfamily domain-containing protein [Phascolomyces articulosus]|uniref:Major facilitator superfamily domain-containing protein n=1 Tax=Phascolomyces articulosus TaxID=60185 RepID=A0AAD5PED9_9FUNG|nr:major facilitator superfamily domain-containing protein [Phascolomyces articulosus]
MATNSPPSAVPEKVFDEKAEQLSGDIESTRGSSDDGFVAPTQEEWRKLLWKLDLRIIPYVGVLYLCSFLDRVNIGNAKVAGLTEDISITDSEYNWALSIFFIGYIIFEVPSNLMLKFIGPSKWISIVMMAWGVTMCAMAAVHNGAGLLASRFFLGITEAGLFPGVIFYLTLWYTRKEQATRLAFFFGCSTLAGAFGGVLAYGIMQMEGIRGLHGWQWIFIIEAIPTLFFACTTYFVLPDFPESKNRFLNDREREILVHRLKVDAGPSTETHFSMKQFYAAFLDWKVYMHAAIYICCVAPLYSLSMFMPTIIKGMGFTSLEAQAMSAPPYAFACVATILTAMHADRRGERGLHLAIPGLLGLVGYILLITLNQKGMVAMYVAACITTIGVFAQIPAMLSWFSNNIGGHTKRGTATAIIVSLGNIGGAVGGQIYRTQDGPFYARGHEICAGLLAGAIVLSCVFKFLLHRINKKRDNLTEEEYKKACEGTDLCDNHPDFRYMT